MDLDSAYLGTNYPMASYYLSTNKNFQIVTLNNITSKFKRMAKKLNQMTNGQITIKRLTEFLTSK